ncbi:iron complex transport system substrate-binding protein [Sinobacterium caligoides]|uniref:Iron complex transport system substrate-binding protein n=1 Tax=Sinobacterium caligoides TaxID=933926 RepID=A0A3N2DY87_9GAMM|nr:iron complex transport system substrate-binding protein [Sinobacterium caligoides]
MLLLSSTTRAEPQRVVSLNLCTDQLVLALAAPQQIAAVSKLAGDELLSNYVKEALQYPSVGKDAEKIVGFNPDLVLATNYTDPILAAWLQRFGYHYKPYELPQQLSAVPAYIQDVAELLGQGDRGRQMTAEFQQRLSKLDNTLPPVRVAVVSANLYVAGGGTLPDQLLRRMGAINVAALDIANGWGYVSLEQLLSWQPDYILMQRDSLNGASRAEQVLSHRALQVLLEKGRRINVPAKYWICAGPELVDAAELINRRILELEHGE